MLKKILYVSAITSLLSANLAYANAVPYVGASLGVIANTSDVKIVGASVAGGNFRGMPVSVFAGYGGVINQNFYLAGEIFSTLATGTLNTNNGLKTTYDFGISLNPGVMLSDHTLAYVRVGGLRTRFSSQNETLSGWQFGFGLQTSVTQNVDLRGEYDYVTYNSFNYSTGSSGSTSITPRSDQFHLALIYKFD